MWLEFLKWKYHFCTQNLMKRYDKFGHYSPTTKTPGGFGGCLVVLRLPRIASIFGQRRTRGTREPMICQASRRGSALQLSELKVEKGRVSFHVISSNLLFARFRCISIHASSKTFQITMSHVAPESFGSIGVSFAQAFRVIRITRIVKAVRLMRIFRFVMALRTGDMMT